MSVSYRCPNCHSRLIGITKIYNKDLWNLLIIYGYCPSLRCKVKRVAMDSEGSILNVERYRSLNVKKKVIAKILKQNWKNYNYKTKKRLYKKYAKLINL